MSHGIVDEDDIEVSFIIRLTTWVVRLFAAATIPLCGIPLYPRAEGLAVLPPHIGVTVAAEQKRNECHNTHEGNDVTDRGVAQKILDRKEGAQDPQEEQDADNGPHAFAQTSHVDLCVR